MVVEDDNATVTSYKQRKKTANTQKKLKTQRKGRKSLETKRTPTYIASVQHKKTERKRPRTCSCVYGRRQSNSNQLQS